MKRFQLTATLKTMTLTLTLDDLDFVDLSTKLAAEHRVSTILYLMTILQLKFSRRLVETWW